MDVKESVAYLRSPKAIREQCGRLYELGAAGRLTHFALAPERIPETAAKVLEVMKANYPDLNVPYHSRWRHFDAARMATLNERIKDMDVEQQARVKVELAIVSVLLDAGAGDKWAWKDEATGKTLSKSEGLAAASFDMFVDGGFSSDPDDPLRVDPEGLKAVTKRELSAYFQVSPANPLAGIDGRVALLGKLGQGVATQKRYFGEIEPRLGNLHDFLASLSGNLKLPARKVLSAVLESLGGIWPGRIVLGGANLGDVWRHSALPQGDLGQGLVPFHKLSQWLTYSLVEPLEDSGFVIGAVDELTGLAEYRNGGLFIDTDVIKPKSPDILKQTHKPDSEVIVEWRALTVCLLDRVADEIRRTLGRSPDELPLAKVLEGGTWATGRKVAKERRPDGGPPLKLASDGTVF